MVARDSHKPSMTCRPATGDRAIASATRVVACRGAGGLGVLAGLLRVGEESQHLVPE